MPVVYSQIPKEQFRDLIPTFRNPHLVPLITKLTLLHQQIHGHGGTADRSGIGTPFRNLVLKHVAQADRVRARLTYNPDALELEALKIPDVDAALTAELAAVRDQDTLGVGDYKASPSASVVVPTSNFVDLPFKYDGSDDSGTVKLVSQLEHRFRTGPGYLIFQAVNEAIVQVSRVESRFSPAYISLYDSARILYSFQSIVGLALNFMGEANRVDVPESVLQSEQPSGGVSPNSIGESSGQSGTP